MAYDPENPPSLIAQGVGGPSGLRWFALMWIDPIADVLAPGYISNAQDIGMRPGDGLIYKDVNRGEWDHYDLICLSVDADGSAVVAFPEIPEEALLLAETFDPEDPSAYVVMMLGGRQVRVDASQFAMDTIQNASQAEAEAGIANDKRMTPLRTSQAIAALQRLLASQAEAEAGIDNTKDMTALRVAQAIAAKVPTITVFAASLLDDPDAAAARSTLGIQPIATAAEYRANTADRTLDTDGLWAAAAYVSLTDAATVAVDMATFLNAQVTLGGNRTLGAPSNAKPGQSGVIVINQDGTGGRTLAFNAAYHFAFGTDPVLSTAAGARDVLFYQVLTSSIIMCSFAKSMG